MAQTCPKTISSPIQGEGKKDFGEKTENKTRRLPIGSSLGHETCRRALVALLGPKGAPGSKTAPQESEGVANLFYYIPYFVYNLYAVTKSFINST